MLYRRMGHSGLKLSVLSIGSWVTYGKQVDDTIARACIHGALDAGVNFIDNAEAYAMGEAERVVGEIIKGMRREDLVISSKVFWGGEGPNDRGLSRKHVVEACHGALRRLQLDYLDLYYCHRPDPDTPVEETALTMDMLIRQGKILYWGTSEWTAAQLQRAYEVCDRWGLIPPSVEQPEYNLFRRERVEEELAPLIRERGLGTTIWSPLASGLLTGKYDAGIPEQSRAALPGMSWLKESFTQERLSFVRALEPLARELGFSRAQLCLAWAARHPHVSTVITGASRLEQVEQNMAALPLIEQWDASLDEAIEQLLNQHIRSPS